MTLIVTLIVAGAFIVNPILGIAVVLLLWLIRTLAKSIIDAQSEPHIPQFAQNFPYFLVGPRYKPLGAVLFVNERGAWLFVKFDV